MILILQIATGVLIGKALAFVGGTCFEALVRHSKGLPLYD